MILTKKIRFGLTAIKGMGEETVDMIIRERKKNGKFQSLQDFAKRVPAKLMNKKTLEALAFSGAFDEFGDRGAIVESLEDLARFAKEHQEKKESGQMGLFGGMDDSAIDFTLKNTKATKEDILRWERESMGLFVSDHPLKGLSAYFEKYGHLIGKLTEAEDLGKKRTIHGLVTIARKIVTKKGRNMAVLEVEDTSGKMECAVFPQIYDNMPSKALEIDAFIRVRGKVEERDGNLNMIVDEVKVGDLTQVQSSAEIFTPAEEQKKVPKNLSVYALRIPEGTTKDKVQKIKQLLSAHKVESPAGQSVKIKLDGHEVTILFRVNINPEFETKLQQILI